MTTYITLHPHNTTLTPHHRHEPHNPHLVIIIHPRPTEGTAHHEDQSRLKTRDLEKGKEKMETGTKKSAKIERNKHGVGVFISVSAFISICIFFLFFAHSFCIATSYIGKPP